MSLSAACDRCQHGVSFADLCGACTAAEADAGGAGVRSSSEAGSSSNSSDSSDSLPKSVHRAAKFANEGQVKQPFTADEFEKLKVTAHVAREVFSRLLPFGVEEKRAQLSSLCGSNLNLHRMYSHHVKLVAAGWNYDDEWGCYARRWRDGAAGKWEWEKNELLQEWVGTFVPEVVDLEGPEQKPAWKAVTLPRPVAGMQVLMEPRAEKSTQRGTSMAAAARFQPKSRQTGRRKQEAQYAEETRKRQRAESFARGGRKRRQGGLHQEEVQEGEEQAGEEQEGEKEDQAGEGEEGENHGKKHEGELGKVSRGRPTYSAVPYTPGQEAGRSRRGQRKDISLFEATPFSCRAHISYASAKALGEFMIENGFVDDRRGKPCDSCGETQRKKRNADGGVLQLGEAIRRPKPWMTVSIPIYVCSVNAKHTRQITRGHEDLFPGPMSPVNIRMFMEFLWRLADGMDLPSCTKLARDVGFKPDSLRPYYNRVLEFVAMYQAKQNAELRLGGAGNPEASQECDRAPREVEMDEMCFRTKAVILRDAVEAFPDIQGELSEGLDMTAAKVIALRVFGAMDRGSSQVFLDFMVPKLVESGGGGPIEKEELWRMLGNIGEDAAERPFRVRFGSVIHTDSARAYANLGYAPFQETESRQSEALAKNLPAEGQVVQNERLGEEKKAGFHEARRVSTEAAKYACQKYAVTHVVHKKKPGIRRSFVKLAKVRLHDGDEAWVKAGTELIDGHWAMLRKCVSRTPVNTWRLGALHRNLRFFQWKYWQGPGVAKLAAMGKAMRVGREMQEASSGVPSALRAHATNVRLRLRSQRQAAGNASAAARAARASPAPASPTSAAAPERSSSRPINPAMRTRSRAPGVASASSSAISREPTAPIRPGRPQRLLLTSRFVPQHERPQLRPRTRAEAEADATRMFGPRLPRA